MGPFRWGIGARLAIAFAAVAVLAVVANVLVEREISIIHTTRVVRVPMSPALPVAIMAAPVEPTLVSPKALIGAIEKFEAAVRSRLDAPNEDSSTRIATAVRDLEHESQVYFAKPELSGKQRQLATVHSHILAFRAAGEELLRAADARQRALKEFWQSFEAMDVSTKAALAQSWKIFGRVIARKSLVDLNSQLDAIRRDFANLPGAGLLDGGALDAVTKNESALASSLAISQSSLARSQGQDWVSQMQANLDQIRKLQDLLVTMDGTRRVAEKHFANDSRSVIDAVAATAPAPTAPSASALNHAEQTSPVEIEKRNLIAAPLDADSNNVTETTSSQEGKPEKIALLFWLSIAVLLVLLAICIGTVLSVTGPVRRMRTATRRLTSGETAVQVDRGGIRELDDLAQSFNQMASQLAEAKAMARNYQDRLEAKVSLRTRELQHLAEHDPLTQLPNRRHLFTHLKTAIVRAQASGGSVGVFFVDLDNFKNINDSLGHAFGDRVLGTIAQRLHRHVMPSGFAARLGGDEFTIVCDDIIDLAAATKIGQELVSAFQQPVVVDARELIISISVGASVYPDHGKDAEALLRAADTALFRAKALGRSRLSVFDPMLLEEASSKFSTEQGLRYALERGEFELAFQPEIDAATLQPHLVEALLRWRLPDGRLAAASEFLAVAEESGLIMEISDWVLRTAIETAAHWHHGAWPQARVAINLSSRQLLDSRFFDYFTALLREHRLPPHCIEIELTENVLQTGVATVDVLRQLRNHGVAIALDDFGIGYSSLASLEQLPLTRVKLDRALIASIHTSARSAAITRALVGLCHGIGLQVTAEGIECTEQLQILSSLAPISLQGYLLARPVPAEQLLTVLTSLPNHMTSLLLTDLTKKDASVIESSAPLSLVARRALRG
jgi:diguanylate cyclase (GGDEF)-like protein